MSESTQELIVMVVAGLSLIGAVLFTLAYIQDRQYQCINTLKDKPAAEIRVVCK